MFRLYRTASGIHLEHEGERRDASLSLDDVFRASEPVTLLQQAWKAAPPAKYGPLNCSPPSAPRKCGPLE